MQEEPGKLGLEAVGDDGVTVEYDELFRFEDDDRHFVVFTDDTEDEEGNLNVYAATYDPHSLWGVAQPVVEGRDWRLVEMLLAAEAGGIG